MKTLVIYASTYGYTKDCVEQLKAKLQGESAAVNVLTDTIPALDAYDNIIIGGSIYMGQIQSKLKEFCANHKQLLIGKRLALFLCCGLPENFETVLSNAFPEEIIKAAITKECFGGELRPDRMKFMHKMIAGMMKKVAAKEGTPEPLKMPENINKLALVINNR